VFWQAPGVYTFVLAGHDLASNAVQLTSAPLLVDMLAPSIEPGAFLAASATTQYVAVADLIPGLHKRTELRESLAQVGFIGLGILSIWIITALD